MLDLEWDGGEKSCGCELGSVVKDREMVCMASLLAEVGGERVVAAAYKRPNKENPLKETQ